jgi:hypothetical protein
MRATRYCSACDKKLAFCVRSDRRFCKSSCRVWAFRHPGQKRPDDGCGRVRLPNRPGQGQPKTLAQAKAALSDARKYAAKLEATARAQNSEERKLLSALATLRAGMSDVQRDLAAAQDDRAHTQERLDRAEEDRNAKIRESYQRLRQIERLQRRLKRTENELHRKQAELAQVQTDAANARRGQDRRRAEHERQLNEAYAELQELTRGRDELLTQIQALTAECERLRSRSELAQLHDNLTTQIDDLTARAEALTQQVEEAEEERRKHENESAADPSELPPDDSPAAPPLSMVQLLQRRLQDEQARRIAAEERIAQLLSESDAASRHRQPHTPPSPTAPPAAPGQYQRHAVSVGYDFTRDPLLALMRDEVTVSDRCADWQALHCLRRTARRRDPAQTLDEQAYAAAIAARWRLIDHPHVRLVDRPSWRLMGCLLDERSERYLLTLTQERIDEMRGWIGGCY